MLFEDDLAAASSMHTVDIVGIVVSSFEPDEKAGRVSYLLPGTSTRQIEALLRSKPFDIL